MPLPKEVEAVRPATHSAILALAVATTDLEDVRADPRAEAEEIQRAATDYRDAEAKCKEAVDAEVKAWIAAAERQRVLEARLAAEAEASGQGALPGV